MQYQSYRSDSLDLNQNSPFFWDHVIRYWWASDFCKNKKVLDCACGKGYGSYILSKKAAAVIGIDLNPTSLEIAGTSFQSVPNLQFKKQDIFNLQDLNQKFDLITAFEVIEHISPEATADFLSSLKKVLAPGGMIIISTPNHDVVTKSGVSIPAFHINNFKASELQQILKKHFKQVEMIGQFKRRNGIGQLLFDFDYLNLRHFPGKIIKTFKNKSAHSKSFTAEDETNHDIFGDQLLNINDFQEFPATEFGKYRFSPKHFRQAGLTIAICK